MALAFTRYKQGHGHGTKRGNQSSPLCWATIRLMLGRDQSGPVGMRVGKKETPQCAGSFLPPAHSTSARPTQLTLLPCLGDDVSRALAHHFGDIQGTVGLIGNGDGAVNGFSLDLREDRQTSLKTQPTLRPNFVLIHQQRQMHPSRFFPKWHPGHRSSGPRLDSH